MLTRQHLMVYGHVKTVGVGKVEVIVICSTLAQAENQVGMIHQDLDVEAAVRYAYNDAKLLCESCYLTAPKLEIKSRNVTCPDNK